MTVKLLSRNSAGSPTPTVTPWGSVFALEVFFSSLLPCPPPLRAVSLGGPETMATTSSATINKPSRPPQPTRPISHFLLGPAPPRRESLGRGGTGILSVGILWSWGTTTDWSCPHSGQNFALACISCPQLWHCLVTALSLTTPLCLPSAQHSSKEPRFALSYDKDLLLAWLPIRGLPGNPYPRSRITIASIRGSGRFGSGYALRAITTSRGSASLFCCTVAAQRSPVTLGPSLGLYVLPAN